MCSLNSDFSAPAQIKIHTERPHDMDANRLFNEGAIYIERT